MKKYEYNKKYLRILLSKLFYLAFSSYVYSAIDTEYEFNNELLIGQNKKIDLNRFNYTSINEGNYSVDVYTNNNFKGRHNINLMLNNKEKLSICYTPRMLNEFGLSPEKLNEKLSTELNKCYFLEIWNSDIHELFDATTFRLDIKTPQIYQLNQSPNYLRKEFWDSGISALNLSYFGNYYNSKNSNSISSENGYLSFNAGYTVNDWLLKYNGNANWNNNRNIDWDSKQIYIQRPFSSIKSKLVVGQFYTQGSLVESINLRGLKLTSDDSMYPDSTTIYSPEIHGTAQTNALVTIRQNGYIIYQTTVAPGAFILRDINPIGYGHDLNVTIKEADGSESIFAVPYASLPQLLRPGFGRYELALGRPEINTLKNKPYVVQGTFQYGINNTFSMYTGITAFDDYQAIIGGTGINTGIGALAVDISQAHSKIQNHSKHGQSYRIAFNRSFPDTKTNLQVNTYRYSTDGFYTANEALLLTKNNNEYSNSWHEKDSFNYTISQDISNQLGSVFFTGRIISYWDHSDKNKQYQLSYNNQLDRLSYTISLSRIYFNNNFLANKNDQVSVSFSYPLSIENNYHASLNSNTMINKDGFQSSQLGINGSLTPSNNWTYGLNTSASKNQKQSIALNSSYKASLMNLSANISKSDKYHQLGVGISGSAVAHSNGITFTPSIATTMALVEAKDAYGASFLNSPETKIDKNGYALFPYIRPYRVNSIELDPKGSPENIKFDNTIARVIPYEGSIVHVKFNSRKENNNVLVINQVNSDPLPFGAEIIDKDNNNIGIVGQGSTLFINTDLPDLIIVKWENGHCSFKTNLPNIQGNLCD